jgi:hypothetical protein
MGFAFASEVMAWALHASMATINGSALHDMVSILRFTE